MLPMKALRSCDDENPDGTGVLQKKENSSFNKKGEGGTKPPLCLRDLTKNHGISATKKSMKQL
eukprot:5151177-Ditylum_brightwellii.AAC.1